MIATKKPKPTTDIVPASQIPDPLTQLRTTAARAAEAVRAAQDVVLAAQEAAIPAVLRLRDWEDLHRAGIVLDGDPALLAAREAAGIVRQALTKARAGLLRAEQAKVPADQAVVTATAAVDREWRRVWSEAHHPELLSRLAAARAEEAKVRANPYTGTSTQGMGDLRHAQARIVAVEEAIARVAKQAPSLGPNVTLPADWATLTPEQRRAWVLRADQLATLAG
jgi:hypothetical protein